jgi:Tol biopolymer transport system component/DNA-binding winged helix-turn-helix (wHTH) protein
MVESLHSPRLISFGIFEVDLQAGELRRAGQKLKLTGQPLQVLTILLERPGEVVTREELQKRLWPDTFVDIDHSLNATINKIREALGDSAESPRWIETLPRRGYRFIGPVENRLDPYPPTTLGTGTHAAQRTGTPRLWLGLAAALVVIVLVARPYGPPPPTVTNAVQISNDRKAKSPLNPPVTDGVRLYFIEGMPWTTGSGIAQMSATGGETTWITTTLQDPVAILGISPDRSELLVQNGVAESSDLAGELWVQPLPAGAPRRVGNIIASSACWTPDATHIVYAFGQAIMIANKDGSEPHELANVPGVPRAFRFSPDGRRIRFYLTQVKAVSNSIWEMGASGKDIHPLFPDWKESPYQCCGNWSPDGNYYYFQAGSGSTQAIWVMPERRSIFRRAAAPWRLVSGPLRYSSPVPSSDGKRLFVVGEEPRVELFRYDLQTQRFDSYLPGLSAGPVDFSSDGKWMAYVSYPDMTLWRSRVDGSAKMQLTFPPVRAYEPRWSPDGSQIVFMDLQFSFPWRIRLLSSSGGGSPELLLQASTDEADADPTWTPDGESIVFGKSDTYGKGAIYRLDLNTRKVSTIPDSNGLFSPRLSRDARYVAALTKDGTKLMLFDTNTNRWSSLAEGKHLGYNEWSHDGKYIYMRESRGGAGELVRVKIKDRVLEHVLSLKDFPQLADIFVGWIGLTPDDAPLLMRDRSVQEIYALDLRFP